MSCVPTKTTTINYYNQLLTWSMVTVGQWKHDRDNDHHDRPEQRAGRHQKIANREALKRT